MEALPPAKGSTPAPQFLSLAHFKSAVEKPGAAENAINANHPT